MNALKCELCVMHVCAPSVHVCTGHATRSWCTAETAHSDCGSTLRCVRCCSLSLNWSGLQRKWSGRTAGAGQTVFTVREMEGWREDEGRGRGGGEGCMKRGEGRGGGGEDRRGRGEDERKGDKRKGGGGSRGKEQWRLGEKG